MESGFFKDNDGRKLKTFTWTPSEPVKALVFLSHGYAEHLVPYYSELAEDACGRGLVVFGHDHVGHGESEGDRVIVKTMSEYTEPVIQHCKEMMSKHPDKPLFIIGHSMGGLIALKTSLSPNCPELAGMVLMGPLIKPDPQSASRVQIFMAKIASKIVPTFQIGELNVDLVTSFQENRDKIASDELTHHGGIKALLGHVLLESMASLEQNFENVNTPYIMLIGSEDKICNVEGSKEFHKMSGSTDKSIKVIDDGYHHLYIEKEDIRRQTVKETCDWIMNRII